MLALRVTILYVSIVGTQAPTLYSLLFDDDMTILENIKETAKQYRANKAHAVDRLFSFDQCHVFKENQHQGFELIKKVSEHFSVPFRSIHIVGSAQLGYSFIEDREFIAGESDLDLAIISDKLFLKYQEICYLETKKYQDLTKFPAHGTLTTNTVATQFREYLAKGYFRPDFMPRCDHRRLWLQFFEKLGNDHVDKFKKITCGLYLSELFFRTRQEEIVDRILEV